MKRCRLVSVVKLTTSLATYEHVLIMCCLSFQVFRGNVFYFKSLHVSTWWCKFKFKLEIPEGSFFKNPPGSVQDEKNLHFAWDSEDTFYRFWLTLRKRWRRMRSVEWPPHGRHWPRFACLLALFTLASIACLLHFCVKTSRFDYSIWATPK